jgi:hypothetical protein
MDVGIRIDASGMDRKYFYAFIKGLATIKYKEYLLKNKDTSGEVDESMDLQFLYTNLFNDQDTSLDCIYHQPL